MLAVREEVPMSTALTAPQGLMPALTVHQAAERYNVLVEYTKTLMVKDQDFGTIEGVSKPCLYKAGAEKLCSLFGLTPAFELIEKTESWSGKDTNGEPLFYYFYKCKLYRGGELLGEADGSCNSWEKKYRYREGKRKCPKCQFEGAIIKGKAEYGGGWLCFVKRSGCGAKFVDKDPAIIGQVVASVPNPDIAEIVNTVQKMAQKRALVAAVLITCNASAFYTQDVEDMKTVDVEYEVIEDHHPQGSKQAQKDYLDRRLEEIRKEKEPVPPAVVEWADLEPAQDTRIDAAMAGSRPVVSGTEGGESENNASEPPIVKSRNTLSEFEQRQAKMKAEAEAQVKQATRKSAASIAGWEIQVRQAFGDLKQEMAILTKDDTAYYDVLRKAGFEKSSHIKDQATARKVYKLMANEHIRLKTLRSMQEELLELYATVDRKRFVDALGAHGFDDMTHVNTAEALGPLLAELRDAK